MAETKNGLQQLEDALSNTTEPIVFLFGAGISASLTGKNYSWEQWVRDGIDLLSEDGLKQYYNKKLGDDEGETASPSADTLVSVLEELIGELKASAGAYETWMHNAFEVLPVRDVALAGTLKRLLTFQDLFVTTNYDDLLEQATGTQAASYLHPEIVYPMLDSKKNDHVIHIHGRYSTKPNAEEDSIIATDTQYNTILANQGAQFIQNVIGTKSMVFVGCGKTTSDKNVSRFISFARDYLKLDKTSYFLYKAGQNPDGLPDNILPVCYGEDYGDLPAFLEAITVIRLEAFAESHPFIELFPVAVTAERRNSFSSCYFAAEALSFYGRNRELSVIGRFMAEEAPCLWYGICGQSGSGKSRLALELCHRYADSWCSFFLKPYSTPSLLHRFVPYRDTLIIIDDFKGMEKNVAGLIEAVSDLFAYTGFRLRILLCERESTVLSGTWFEDLERSFEKSYLPVFRANRYGGETQNLLVLGDLEDGEIECMIGEICTKQGLPPDRSRDKTLRKTYHQKLEQLHYRPLFVQMYVESWIQNGCSTTRFDSAASLLEDILKREQERWFMELGNDHKLFDAWIRLLLLGVVTNRLTRETIPEKYVQDFDVIFSYVKEHSFPGKQRQERFISLIADMCHNIGQNDACIQPMYPDLIKEYCFLYYLDPEQVIQFSQEAWDFAPEQFSSFLVKILGDFPYHDVAFAAVDGDESYRCQTQVLAARIHVLDNSIIQKGDDLKQIHTWVDREYQFWHEMAEDDDASDEYRTVLIMQGLDKVGQQYGAQHDPLRPTVDKMLGVYDELMALKGGEAVELTRMLQIQALAKRLSVTGMANRAAALLNKLNASMKSELGAELAEETELERFNTEMMDRLIENDFPGGYKVLKRAKSHAEKLNSAEILTYFLEMCHRFNSMALRNGRERFIDRCEYLAGMTEEYFKDDDDVICARHLMRTDRITYDFFQERRRGQKEELTSMLNHALTVNSPTANECLSATAVLLLKFTDSTEEIEDICGKLKTRLDTVMDAKGSEGSLPQAYLQCMIARKKANGQMAFLKKEIEEAYAVMLRYPESESTRGLFFEMLNDSVEANNFSRYMRREVITAAIGDAKFNPMNPSGIDELDAFYDLP